MRPSRAPRRLRTAKPPSRAGSRSQLLREQAGPYRAAGRREDLFRRPVGGQRLTGAAEQRQHFTAVQFHMAQKIGLRPSSLAQAAAGLIVECQGRLGSARGIIQFRQGPLDIGQHRLGFGATQRVGRRR